MKIYTKTGDKGNTKLFGGQLVSKSDKRIELLGEIDELNSSIGVVVSTLTDKKKDSYSSFLKNIQCVLFEIGAIVANPSSEIEGKEFEIEVEKLEKEIDVIDKKLPELRFFILPGGTIEASYSHLSRTICRRVERKIVVVLKEENITESQLQIYLNRLSDFLFVLARFLNLQSKVEDIPWVAKENRK